MSRPRKNTVDYFPHSCTHGKTIFIIQERFGNDGYACWFRILEELGKANNHVIDVRNPVNYEYLTAATHVSPGLLRQILDLLAKLGAIDKELWGAGAIYSQNFVDNVSDAYRNRLDSVPTKQVVIGFLTSETKFLTQETEFLPISDIGNPQSKLKKSKKKNTKEEISKTVPPKRHNFTPPTLNEVKEHCKEKKYTFDPEAFWAFYESKGWMIGKNKMKSWKSACVTWQKKEPKKSIGQMTEEEQKEYYKVPEGWDSGSSLEELEKKRIGLEAKQEAEKKAKAEQEERERLEAEDRRVNWKKYAYESFIEKSPWKEVYDGKMGKKIKPIYDKVVTSPEKAGELQRASQAMRLAALANHSEASDTDPVEWIQSGAWKEPDRKPMENKTSTGTFKKAFQSNF